MADNTPARDDPHRKLGARHLRRVVLLLQISCAVTGIVCLGWTVYFSAAALWGAAVAFFTVVVAALVSYRLACNGRVYVAGGIQFLAMYSIICGVCAFLDLPSEQVARSTHLFLLPAGAGAHMGLRGAKASR